jgi:hypothetical protein
MTRTKLLSILQEETDGFNEQSRLRDDVLDAMEEAYLKGKREQLNIPVVVGQSEQFVCDHKVREPNGLVYSFRNVCELCGEDMKAK